MTLGSCAISTPLTLSFLLSSLRRPSLSWLVPLVLSWLSVIIPELVAVFVGLAVIVTRRAGTLRDLNSNTVNGHLLWTVFKSELFTGAPLLTIFLLTIPLLAVPLLAVPLLAIPLLPVSLLVISLLSISLLTVVMTPVLLLAVPQRIRAFYKTVELIVC